MSEQTKPTYQQEKIHEARRTTRWGRVIFILGVVILVTVVIGSFFALSVISLIGLPVPYEQIRAIQPIGGVLFLVGLVLIGIGYTIDSSYLSRKAREWELQTKAIEQTERMRTMIECPKCGHYLTAKTPYCPFCGNPLKT